MTRLLPLATMAVLVFIVVFFLAACASNDPTEAEKNAEAIRQLNWCTTHYPTCAARPLDSWFWNYLADYPDGFRLEQPQPGGASTR